MNNLFDIFGPALIASFSSAICYLWLRGHRDHRDGDHMPSPITSLLSLSAALVATCVMQVTIHQAGLCSELPVGEKHDSS